MIEKLWERAGMTCALRHGAFRAPNGFVSYKESAICGYARRIRKTCGEAES